MSHKSSAIGIAFFLAGITRAPGSFGKRTPREVFLKDAPTGRQLRVHVNLLVAGKTGITRVLRVLLRVLFTRAFYACIGA